MLSKLTSDKQLYLNQAEKGSGNVISVPTAFLRDNKEALQQRHTIIYTVTNKTNGARAVAPTSWDYIDELIQAGKVNIPFIIAINWQATPIAPLLQTPLTVEHVPPPTPMADKLRVQLQLSAATRAKVLSDVASEIKTLSKGDLAPEVKSQRILEIVEQTFITNKVTLALIEKNKTVSELDFSIAMNTRNIAASIFEMAENSAISKGFFTCFKQLSNGQTLNHITRVTVMTTSFIQYYNQNILKKHFLIKDEVFREYIPQYKALFPQIIEDNLKFSRLFKVGTIKNTAAGDTTKDIMIRWCLGAYLHDIGKIADLEYHESDSPYDKKIIETHVASGENLFRLLYGIKNEEARLIIRDHHNALFHKEGYGGTRLERKGQNWPPFTISISDNVTDFLHGYARGFLPTEMLALVDIFDAATDPSRKYKKPLSSIETAEMLFEKVLQLKLDPLLFDIFIDFLRSLAIAVPENYGLSVKLQRH